MNQLVMLHNIIITIYICIMITGKHKSVHETYDVNRKMKMASDIVLAPSFQRYYLNCVSNNRRQ
jgi:hypothetical protein